ncbi:MAG: MTAP family purine nucleoside phosphorylase [Candidatus Lokiarchaeota archaeon]|nr:MTAP family purine nucleoside phosphorylase [Candidatus Lokiarchaeota archaeon]
MKNNDINADIAIIGGTGSDIHLENADEVKIFTPFGNSSSKITIGDFKDKKIAYIPRHGKDHSIPPHNINFRANIWALKELGVKFVISTSAVGSLKAELSKGTFVIVDQYIDRTKKRGDTFFEGGQVCHIGQADPYCEYMRSLFYDSGKNLEIEICNGGTYVCIEGPRFSTRSESNMFRLLGGDIIGMTTYPEVVLAAEKEICYCCIAMITDLDVWAGNCPNCGIVAYKNECDKCGNLIQKLSVAVSEVMKTMEENTENLKKLLEMTIPKINTEKDCSCHHTLLNAIL